MAAPVRRITLDHEITSLLNRPQAPAAAAAAAAPEDSTLTSFSEPPTLRELATDENFAKFEDIKRRCLEHMDSASPAPTDYSLDIDFTNDQLLELKRKASPGLFEDSSHILTYSNV
jgi:hypothetical protein